MYEEALKRKIDATSVAAAPKRPPPAPAPRRFIPEPSPEKIHGGHKSLRHLVDFLETGIEDLFWGLAHRCQEGPRTGCKVASGSKKKCAGGCCAGGGNSEPCRNTAKEHHKAQQKHTL